MKRVTYYGIAENPKGRVEAVLVTCENQKMISQEWTGVTYRSQKEAYEEIGKLNELVAKAIQRETGATGARIDPALQGEWAARGDNYPER